MKPKPRAWSRGFSVECCSQIMRGRLSWRPLSFQTKRAMSAQSGHREIDAIGRVLRFFPYPNYETQLKVQKRQLSSRVRTELLNRNARIVSEAEHDRE